MSERTAGGLKELWMISFPLMISCLFTYLTMFIERCFITYYSLDALNAIVNASTFCWGLLGGTAAMAGMTEIFVAQFNGAGHKKYIGESVWQMIWFSLLTSLVFIPLGLFGPDLFYQKNSMEASYFRWVMCFGAFQPLSYALTTFFVGRKQVKWITVLALSSTIFNALLDALLIFGLKGWIPELGVKGAAIANCISLSLQAAILMVFFLRKHNREMCGTGNWKPDPKAFWKSCRFTVPPAILYNVELLGWSFFYWMMTSVSHIHITIASLCQSLILLFSFFGDGIGRGASVLANNYLGAGDKKLVSDVLRSASLILILFFTAQALLLCFNPNLFIKSFLPIDENIELLTGSLEVCLWFVLVFLLFQGFQWTLSAILYANGETFFVMIAGSCSIFCFLLFPTYLFVVKKGISPHYAWALVAFYGLSSSILYWWRFRQKCYKQPAGIIRPMSSTCMVKELQETSRI
ncbi:MAG: MATE family efflux transporter [Anaerolineae bacterium]